MDMNETGYDELARHDDDDAHAIGRAPSRLLRQIVRRSLIRACKKLSVAVGGVAALHGVIPDALTTMAMPGISDITKRYASAGGVCTTPVRPWSMRLKRPTWWCSSSLRKPYRTTTGLART